MIAPGNHSARTKAQHCAGVPLQGWTVGTDLNLAGGKKLDGYAVSIQNLSGQGVKLGMTDPHSHAGATCKPVEDNSAVRTRLQHSADLIGRTFTQERYGHWNTAHHLGTSTYAESPRLSTRIVPNESGSGCPVRVSPRELPQLSKRLPHNVTDSGCTVGASPCGSPRLSTRIAPHGLSGYPGGVSPRGEKQAQKALLDSTCNKEDAVSGDSLKGDGSTCNQEGTVSLDGSLLSPRPSSRTVPKKLYRDQSPKSSTVNVRPARQSVRDYERMQTPQSCSGVPVRSAQQDMSTAKKASSRGVTPGAGGYPAHGELNGGGSTRPVVSRIAGLSSLSKVVSQQSSACSPDSQKFYPRGSRTQGSKQKGARSPDVTYRELPCARKQLDFLQSVLKRSQVLRTGGDKLTQDCKESNDTETTASSCQYQEESIEVVGLEGSGQDSVLNDAASDLEGVSNSAINDQPKQQLKGSHEAPANSLSQSQFPDEDCQDGKDGVPNYVVKDQSASRPSLELTKAAMSMRRALAVPPSRSHKSAIYSFGRAHPARAIVQDRDDLQDSHEAPLSSVSQHLFLDQDVYEQDGLDSMVTEITASSHQTSEEDVEVGEPGTKRASTEEVHYQSTQEAPLHSASLWLAASEHAAKDAVPEDLPDTPRSFRCTPEADTDPAWDQQGFPVHARLV